MFVGKDEDSRKKLQRVRSAHSASAHTVRFGVVKFFFNRVEFDRSFKLPRDVRAVGRNMRLRGDGGVCGRHTTRFDAFDKFGDVRRRLRARHAEIFEFAAQFVVRNSHTSAVARFDPAFFADVTRGAGAKTEPTVGTHHQFYAVVVIRVNVPRDRAVVVELRLVTNRRRMVFFRRPLAEVDRMGAPFENAAAVEVELAAPIAANVGAVIGTPRARTKPTIPVDFVNIRLRLGGIPVLICRRPKRVGVNFGILPSLPLWIIFAASIKLPMLRRCVPA